MRLYTALSAVAPAVPETIDWTDEFAARFKQEMDDDFNTAGAISVLFELANAVNSTRDAGRAGLLKALGGILNILQRDPEQFLKGGKAAVSEERIAELIAERAAAKKARNWGRADEIRASLKEAGIELLDGPQGTTWRKI